MDLSFYAAIIVVLALLVVGLVFFFSRKRTVSTADRKFFLEKWQGILGYEDFHRAILDADKLLDLALKKKGYEGSLGEKLKRAGKLFSKLDDVWAAHKFRNRVAHELQMTIHPGEGKKILGYFKRAFQDLGFL